MSSSGKKPCMSSQVVCGVGNNARKIKAVQLNDCCYGYSSVVKK